MNDVITKRRPMIDLDEFERRLGRPCSTDQRDGDPLAELLRIIGDKDEPHKTDLEPKTQLSAMARPDIGETGEWKQPDAQAHLVGGNFAAIEAGLLGTKQPDAVTLRDAERSTVENKRPKPRVPLLSGDFAAIEAALLGALREQTTATVPETDMANAFPSVDLGSEGRLYQHDQPASRHTGVAGGQIKSRRRRYVIGAIVFVGMAGVAVSFGLNSRLSGQSDIASIEADNGPDNPQTDAMSNADVPAQDAANSQRAIRIIAHGSRQWHQTNLRLAASGGEITARLNPTPKSIMDPPPRRLRPRRRKPRQSHSARPSSLTTRPRKQISMERCFRRRNPQRQPSLRRQKRRGAW